MVARWRLPWLVFTSVRRPSLSVCGGLSFEAAISILLRVLCGAGVGPAHERLDLSRKGAGFCSTGSITEGLLDLKPAWPPCSCRTRVFRRWIFGSFLRRFLGDVFIVDKGLISVS